VWLARGPEGIVGHHGSIAIDLKLGPERRTTGWLVDTMVLEDWRRKAVGPRLVIHSNEEMEFALSLGQTEQMRKILLRLGWEQVAPLQTAQLILRPEAVLRGKLPGVAATAAGWGLRAMAALRKLLQDHPHGEVREVRRFGPSHDRLWEEASRDIGCAAARDASYLNWKYVDQPGGDFLRLELYGGRSPRGIAVLAFREPDAAYRYRRAFLVDLVAPLSDRRLLTDLLQVAARAAADRGADALVCLHVSVRLTRALRAAGFLLRAPGRFLLAYPGRLPEEPRRRLLAAEDWLITQGDSDIDRPW
jgi:hypothetical protein